MPRLKPRLPYSVHAASARGLDWTRPFAEVMMTVPRVRDPASEVMIESIESYVAPWHANANSTVTVFAHLGPDGKHFGFDHAKAFFATSATKSTIPITFHVSPPPTEGPPLMNHHAHLADAMRYAYASGYEWTMFVEDDFVLCGEWGWEGLMRVLERLNLHEKLNGGFIGTGGRYVCTKVSSLEAHILSFQRRHLPSFATTNNGTAAVDDGFARF